MGYPHLWKPPYEPEIWGEILHRPRSQGAAEQSGAAWNLAEPLKHGVKMADLPPNMVILRAKWGVTPRNRGIVAVQFQKLRHHWQHTFLDPTARGVQGQFPTHQSTMNSGDSWQFGLWKVANSRVNTKPSHLWTLNPWLKRLMQDYCHQIDPQKMIRWCKDSWSLWVLKIGLGHRNGHFHRHRFFFLPLDGMGECTLDPNIKKDTPPKSPFFWAVLSHGSSFWHRIPHSHPSFYFLGEIPIVSLWFWD